MLEQIINQDEESEFNDLGEASDESGSDVKSSSSSMTGNKNILSSDVEIKGKLRFSRDLIIDGRIEGEVNSEGALTVGENAQIIGDIKTRSVTVYGKVTGYITVTDRCELKGNAELNGDIGAAKLAIEEGAVFLGLSTVGTHSTPADNTFTPFTPPSNDEGSSDENNDSGDSHEGEHYS